MNKTIPVDEQIINRIVEADAKEFADMPAFFARLAKEFPGVTEDELIDCFVDAAKELDDIANQHQSQAAAIKDLAPLFEGMPDNMTVGECARIKAEKGDPLAIAFLEWEAKQAGGVQ